MSALRTFTRETEMRELEGKTVESSIREVRACTALNR